MHKWKLIIKHFFRSNDNEASNVLKLVDDNRCSLKDLGKCEIAQTGLDKCEFTQKNYLSLPKTEKNLRKITKPLPKRR